DNIELPSLDEVILVREGDKDGSNLLLKQEEFEFKKPGKVSVHFSANPNGFRIRKYFLQQGVKRIESSGPDLEFEPGKTFSVGDLIHAGVVIDYRDMAIAAPTLLKIRENEEVKKPIDFPMSPSAGVDGDVKFLKGMSGAVKLPFLKFGIEYEDDVITLYVGVDVDAKKKAGERGWESFKGPFKNFIEEVGSGADATRKLWSYWRGQGLKPQATGEASFSAEAGALGYVSLVSEKDGLKVVGGKLVVFGAFGVQVSAQAMAAFIPVYVSIGVGGELTVSFVSDRRPTGLADYFRNVDLTFSPYVDVEGGIGVKGVASVGVALHGGYEMRWQVRAGSFSGKILVDLLLRVNILFIFSWEYKLAGAQYEVTAGGSAPGGGGAGPGRGGTVAGGPVIPSELPSAAALLSGFRETGREYLAAGPEWLGDRPPPEYVRGGDPLELRALKTHLLPGSEPLVVEALGGEFLFWTDDAGPGRASLDRAALMFSRRGADGSWSPGAIVHDDGTGDYDFSVAEHRGILYAAWQNTTRKFGEGSRDIDRQPPLQEICRASEILVAAFDPKSGTFSPPARPPAGEAGTYRGRPRLAGDGKDLALVYVQNSDANSLLATGENRFGYVLMKGDGNWDSRAYPLRAIGKPIVGWDAFLDRGTPYLVTAEDWDGSLETINDRVVQLGWNADPRGSSREAIERIALPGRHANPRVVSWRGKTALFYYAGEKEGGRGNIEYWPDLLSRAWSGGPRRVLAASAAIGDDFSLVGAPKDGLAVLLVDEDSGLRSAPAMIVYDPGRDAWGFPARLAPDQPRGTRAEAPRGVWTKEGRVDIAYRNLPASARGASTEATLELASTRAAPDFAVDAASIYRYYGDEKGGDLLPVSVTVRNTGLATARGLALELFSKQENSWFGASRTGYRRLYKDLVLKPGEEATLTVEYRLPKSAEAPYNLFVFVEGLRGDELNAGNNYGVVPFAEPDLLLGDIEVERRRFLRDFSVPVHNRSPVPLRDVRLELKDGQGAESIAGLDLGTLAPYASTTVKLPLDLAKLSWKSARKDLVFSVSSSDLRKPGFRSDVFALYNPYSYPAFNLAVFDARATGPNYVWVSAAAANNHPERREGDLVIEILDQRGGVAASHSRRVVADAGRTAVVSRAFRVEGSPGAYTVRVWMRNVPKTPPGAPETGGLMEPGGDCEPVEVPITAGRR
ncbi:MAG: hypothetical protein JNG85_02735, partial [Spirochaetaceae bacterium]|nr:hypothetical protein [Spirochaetaceae bacterium]